MLLRLSALLVNVLPGYGGGTDSRPAGLFSATDQANAAQNNDGRHDDVQVESFLHKQDAAQHGQTGHAQLNSGSHRGGKAGQERIPEYVGKGGSDGTGSDRQQNTGAVRVHIMPVQQHEQGSQGGCHQKIAGGGRGCMSDFFTGNTVSRPCRTGYPAFDKKKRTPGWVSWRLQQTAARIRIGRVPLDESLLLMAMKDTPQVIVNREHLRAAEKNIRRLIVVSVLAGWSEAGEARLKTMLPLGLFSGFPDLVLPEDVRHRLERSFSRELGDWRRGMKVVVIAETEPPETSFRQIDGRSRPSSCSTLLDVALMTVSPRFIPLDSGYEGAVEEKLWQEKRAFTKPLRYDGEEDVFPDFVLKDVPGIDALPMEVFGMNSPEYLLRKQEKTTHYEAEYGPGRWWCWNAAEKSDMPAFPCI